MATQMVRILDGNTFVVCDERGDVEASPTEPTGLFSFDMRFLSKWVLTINGQKLNSLSTDDLQYFQSRFFLVPGTGTVYIDAKLSKAEIDASQPQGSSYPYNIAFTPQIPSGVSVLTSSEPTTKTSTLFCSAIQAKWVIMER